MANDRFGERFHRFLLLTLLLGTLLSLVYWGWVLSQRQEVYDPPPPASGHAESGVYPAATLPVGLNEVLHHWFFGSDTSVVMPEDPLVMGWLRSETQGSVLLRWPDGQVQAVRLGAEVLPGWLLQQQNNRYFLRSSSGQERPLRVIESEEPPGVDGIKRSD